MKHDNKGVISVETSMSLTIFIFAFLAITSLTTFVRAESKVQYALNQTAKEFSEYSYIYSKAQEVLGIDGSGNSTEEVDKLVNNLNDFNHMISKATITASQIGSASGKDILETIKSQVNGAYTDAKDIYDSGETLYNQLQSYADNPTVILSQICTVIKDQTLSAAKSQILAPVVAKLLMLKYNNPVQHISLYSNKILQALRQQPKNSMQLYCIDLIQKLSDKVKHILFH